MFVKKWVFGDGYDLLQLVYICEKWGLVYICEKKGFLGVDMSVL